MSTVAWSSSVASSWEGAVAAGSGVVGALLFGAPQRHTMVFSHERFFVPANSRRPAPQLAPVLEQIRELLRGRDEVGAADVIDQRLRELGVDPEELVWTDPLGPLAQLVWETSNRATSEYRRELDLGGGGTSVSWSDGEGHAGIRVRTEHGADWFEVELHADMLQTGRLTLGRVAEQGAGATTVATENHASAVDTAITAAEGGLVAEVTAPGREPGTAVSGRVTVECVSPHVLSGHAWMITIGPDTPAVLRVGIHADAPGPTLERSSAGPAEAILERSTLDLAGKTTGESVEQLWAKARNGDAAAEARVMELAYAAGRRNIYASTGALPPTLQGVWQGTWSPAWSADYTMNGNVQLGALASVLWTGMPELMPSLFRLVTQFPEHYRSNAGSVFGIDGMLLPARLTTHGHANHFLRSYPHEFWIGHGSWLLRMAADYILVTGDRSPLDEWLWEYTQEILAFGLGVVAAADGHFSPSYSPENTPAGRENPLATDAAAEIGALRDGLSVGAWIADLVGEPERAAQWMTAREALPDYRVAPDGTLGEWGAGWEEQVAHRHVSQLHGLWYEPDERLLEPELRSAALATIRAKVGWRAEDPTGPPGRMEMAFGLSSIGLAAAALGDSESAYQCALWLARDHFGPSLMTTHDAGAIFNLDASGALPAVVAAMLLDSTRTSIRVLPALPAAWPTGSVTGLRARGGVHLDRLCWERGGFVADVTLPAASGWLRPAGTVVQLPRPADLAPVGGVEQLDSSTLRIRADIDAVQIAVRYREGDDR